MSRKEFENLLDSCESELYSFSLRLCNNKQDAEELFQDTWLEAIEHIEEIDNSGNPKSYLLGKMIFVWKSKKRKLARREKIALFSGSTEEMENILSDREETLEEAVIKAEQIKCLKHEITNLKDKFRMVIELYYTLEMTSKEIAAILHIPQGTVESRLHKAREILKKKMEDKGYGKE